jgi:hypothetical protein
MSSPSSSSVGSMSCAAVGSSSYIMLPCTRSPNRESKFTLTVYSDQPVSLSPYQLRAP